MKITAKELAKIAAQSPGYSVILTNGETLTNFRVGTGPSGPTLKATSDGPWVNRSWAFECILSIED